MNPICRWFRWLPWVCSGEENGHEAREARESAERKLIEAQNLSARAERVVGRLGEVARENHIRLKMEQAFKGHG